MSDKMDVIGGLGAYIGRLEMLAEFVSRMDDHRLDAPRAMERCRAAAKLARAALATGKDVARG